MNVTQSTVTARLKTLEDEIGQTLLNRHKSGATLTPAGAKLLQYARIMTGLWRGSILTVHGGRSNSFSTIAAPPACPRRSLIVPFVPGGSLSSLTRRSTRAKMPCGQRKRRSGLELVPEPGGTIDARRDVPARLRQQNLSTPPICPCKSFVTDWCCTLCYNRIAADR
ncbi:LysR family transcriptional regulator [uncultured Roseovarius sp.]|uniref:LysR family transcriptional regulator n=1 Tax=uncultured Roseovarius sp. TaxID=293344 RepID=UPI00260B251C|nr:LysR family transcriptional regulator [uncultured Roseovarius sp.]